MFIAADLMLSSNDMIKTIPQSRRQEMLAPRRDVVRNLGILAQQELLKPVVNA